MQVPLTGVANVQILTVQVLNINGGGGLDDVDFGFLIVDLKARCRHGN
jgi:hypothetical protein